MLSHVAMLSIPIVFTIFFCTSLSFISSLFVFFYPRWLSFCFLNGVSSSVYNLSFGIVHLYVGWVTRLTRFSDIWHCALRGLVLSFRYLGLVSHRFIHLLLLAFITVRVDIFHLDRLRPLVEIRDVGRPLFLEDIEELHNDFSVQSPRLWSTIRDRWCRELGLLRTPLLIGLTCSYWGIPPILAWWHQFLHVHMQFH